MTASAIFTAAHANAKKAHTPQFGDVRSYREVFVSFLRAAYADARRAVVLPLPCASFYTARAWSQVAGKLETVYFTTQQQLKDFVTGAIGKTLGVYAQVTAWWGSAEAMRHDLATTGDISFNSLHGSRAVDAKYRELADVDASAYVGPWTLAPTEQEDAEAEAAKRALAAKLALQGIEVDLD